MPRPTTAAPASASASGTADRSRPLRADAARNRQRILEAAEETFAREGLAVPIDVVAERAGVGVGTLYRHFPTKEALFEAIVLTRIDGLVSACEMEDDADPTQGLFDFLAMMAGQVSLKHDLFDALAQAGIDFTVRYGTEVQRLEQGIERLRRRAVESGGLRDDVSTDQIVGLVIGACRGAERPGMDPGSCRRMLDVVLDGLRARH